MEHLLQKSKCSIFHNIFKCMIFQRLFYNNIEKFLKKLSSVLNTFENIMENGAFAPKEQMLHFP